MNAQKGVEVLLYSYFNLDTRWGKPHSPESLLPGKRLDTHRTGGLVGPRDGLDGC
jgi:hypothetical protein